MASGAGERYWDKQALPSVFKHTLLGKYVPQFAGMTGSKTLAKRVVFLDGFAGRGRYEDGRPGSAERIMKMAQDQYASVNLAWSCWFIERDRTSAEALMAVVDEYRAKGVTATAHRGDVLEVLDRVVRDADGCPLFVFLDPCGLGIPFDRLTGMLNDDRHGDWPPTEFLLNFSMEAVRRIGGQAAGEHSDPATLNRMDETVAGGWWRSYFTEGYSDEAVEAVVSGFTSRLRHATGMHLESVPVKRAPGHKPVYHLMFGTRSQHGVWVFGDSVARATQAWWDTMEEVEAEESPDALFTVTETIRPVLEIVEKEAVPAVADNLAGLLRTHSGGYKVLDHTAAVFGDYYGKVREPVIRAGVKELHRRGQTSSTGVGQRPRDLEVLPPAVPPSD